MTFGLEMERVCSERKRKEREKTSKEKVMKKVGKRLTQTSKQHIERRNQKSNQGRITAQSPHGTNKHQSILNNIHCKPLQ